MGEDTTGRASCRPIPLDQLTYTVLDLETTGLQPQGNGITEICCLRVANGAVIDRFATLINPGRPIPPFIQAMTGITDAMVRDVPVFRIAPALLEFLGDSVLVAPMPLSIYPSELRLYTSNYET